MKTRRTVLLLRTAIGASLGLSLFLALSGSCFSPLRSLDLGAGSSTSPEEVLSKHDVETALRSIAIVSEHDKPQMGDYDQYEAINAVFEKATGRRLYKRSHAIGDDGEDELEEPHQLEQSSHDLPPTRNAAAIINGQVSFENDLNAGSEYEHTIDDTVHATDEGAGVESEDDETISVSIVCTKAADFDVVLALVGSIMIPPTVHEKALGDEAIESFGIKGSGARVNLTVIDATDARVSKKTADENLEFEQLKQVMVREVRRLSPWNSSNPQIKRFPITYVKANQLVSAPDVLFLASCFDDSTALTDDISTFLSLGTRTQCIVRNPTKWDRLRPSSEIRTISRLVHQRGSWSFIATSATGQRYMEVYFGNLLSMAFTRESFKGVLSLILPCVGAARKPIGPMRVASILGGDFVRPLLHRQELYQATITAYAKTLPGMPVQLLDHVGGSDKSERYDVPDPIKNRIHIAHNLPLDTYFDRIARSSLIVPLPLDVLDMDRSMRMAERIASVALSIGRPLLLQSTVYSTFFEQFVPPDMVSITTSEHGDQHLLAGLKAYAELHKSKHDELVLAAMNTRSRLIRRNWLVINHIVENISAD